MRLPIVGLEPTRSYLQWILGPPLDHAGKVAMRYWSLVNMQAENIMLECGVQA